jgi:two-component system, NarL family, sensor histidine kinase BarA
MRKSNFSSKKVLLVEDNPMLQKISQCLLSDLGYDVVCEISGVEALAHYTPDYDAIFMDLQLPGSNGIETTRKLREKFNTDRTPIYACTSFDKSIWPQCEKAGMDGFLAKPFSKKQLENFLNHHAHKSHQSLEKVLRAV